LARALTVSAKKNKIVVRLLLDKGADIEAKDKDGQTPLSRAARNRQEAVVQLLQAHINNIPAVSTLTYNQNTHTEFSMG